MTSKTAVQNITSVYQESTQTEREWGARWYNRAHEIAVEIATENILSVSTVCGVIASLSPNCSWSTNVKDTKRLIWAHAHGVSRSKVNTATYRPNKDKAWRILDGEKPLHVLGGPKVRSFYKNILCPNRSLAVTVDFHSISIARGVYTTMDRAKLDPVHRKYTRAKWYVDIADAFREASKYLGISPHVLQATTWICWRRIHVLGDQKYTLF